MLTGKALLQTVGAAVAKMLPADDGVTSTTRLRIETSAGFDRNITIKKRLQNSVALTSIASYYIKEADGTVASAVLAPGVSNKSEYLIDNTGCQVEVDISGGTAGTADFYWTTVSGVDR